jgi:transcriptional regulator with XRE-family HTH domain
LKIEEAFAQALKQIRSESGLSQAELARKCGCNVMSISKLERGLTQPSLSFMLLLAKGMEADPRQLFDATLEREPEIVLPLKPSEH